MLQIRQNIAQNSVWRKGREPANSRSMGLLPAVRCIYRSLATGLTTEYVSTIETFKCLELLV